MSFPMEFPELSGFPQRWVNLVSRRRFSDVTIPSRIKGAKTQREIESVFRASLLLSIGRRHGFWFRGFRVGVLVVLWGL